MRKGDYKNTPQTLSTTDPQGIPYSLATVSLTDPNKRSDEPSLGELVKDATAQISTLVRAEMELARAEITTDIKKGLSGSVFFIAALTVLFYSTFFFFFFLAELLDEWLKRWAAFLIVFGLMVVSAVVLAFLGFLRVRRIRGPQQTVKSLRQARDTFLPSSASSSSCEIPEVPTSPSEDDEQPVNDPSGW